MRVLEKKKILGIFLALILGSAVFYACNDNDTQDDPVATLMESAPVDGDQIVLWFAQESLIVGTEINEDSRFEGIESSAEDGTLPVYEEAAVFDVGHDSADDVYTFSCDGQYLTSTGKNNLALTDTLDEDGCSTWALEETDTGWLLKNVGASGDDGDIYFEYYKTGFTTYYYYDSSASAYTFDFYAFNGYAADPSLNYEDQEAPTGLLATAPGDASNNDGTISGTTTEMEYKLVSASDYTACPGIELENLVPGDYAVRYAEKEGFNASPDTTVTVPFYGDSEYIVNTLVMQPGVDESQMNFCWYSNSADSAEVQLALKADMTGNSFPEYSATVFTGTIVESGDYMSNKVIVTGLTDSTSYVYRVGDGLNFGAVYEFSTRDSSSYNAILVGDPQIGCSGSIIDDMDGWEETVTTAMTSFPESSFILSAGDQVETAASEAQYDAFFNAGELVSLPLVSTIGNHDNNALYSYHFNSPNESEEYGVTDAGGDYYFRYGNTLFMVINSNNTSATSHEASLTEAIENAGDGIIWKAVMFHHAIYSSATHSTDADILSRREDLYPIFDALGVDVVLMGHDHVYSRSHQMLDGAAQTDQATNADGQVVDPAGTLYLTVNSSSGSKYYDLIDQDTDYRAYRWQGYEPSYTNVEVTDTTFTVTTYTSADNTQIDTYSIYKSGN